MKEFNKFIDLTEVVDVPIIGSNFTWMNMEGSTGSRLDRLFFTEGAIDSWKVVGQKPSQRNIRSLSNLDHSK